MDLLIVAIYYQRPWSLFKIKSEYLKIKTKNTTLKTVDRHKHQNVQWPKTSEKSSCSRIQQIKTIRLFTLISTTLFFIFCFKSKLKMKHFACRFVFKQLYCSKRKCKERSEKVFRYSKSCPCLMKIRLPFCIQNNT